jgi:NAD(P)-dependent dehydrogenase (short-subunit alcohol dehydrogenase family)
VGVSAVSRSWTVEVPHERVVVTGGGSGIGRAVTLELARGGVDVIVLGRRMERLAETVSMAEASPGAVIPVVCDIRHVDQVDAAFEQAEAHGRQEGSSGLATGLVNAAAQVSMLQAKDLTPAEFGNVVNATLLAAYNVVHRWGLPLLDAGVGGSAVLITSSNASMGAPGLSHSSAGKAGTNALVKSLGREWGPYGITLNTVGPGPFPVEKSQAMWADETTRSRMFKEVPLGRYGALGEIVGPIMFFLSSGGGFTTGQVLTVDGGLSLQHWPLPPEEMGNGQTVWAPNFDPGTP